MATRNIKNYSDGDKKSAAQIAKDTKRKLKNIKSPDLSKLFSAQIFTKGIGGDLMKSHMAYGTTKQSLIDNNQCAILGDIKAPKK